MSFTITAQAIPSVALGSWETIDRHLLEPTADWVILRAGLLHAVCERVSKSGDQVSRLEEVLLIEYYAAPPVRASFLDVLAFIRQETENWPAEARQLVEHLYATNPDHPIAAPAAFTLADIRRVASRATTPPPTPARDLNRFRNPRRSAVEVVS